jgi:hypothetical protein
MTMKQHSWFTWLAPLVLILAACAPAPRTVPPLDPVFYAAEPLEVMGAVIQAISTSPGLDDSTGWFIAESDTQGGFVRAETEVIVPRRFLRPPTTRTEAVTVVVSPAGANRTQVIIQHTSGAESLADHIQRELRGRFGLN